MGFRTDGGPYVDSRLNERSSELNLFGADEGNVGGTVRLEFILDRPNIGYSAVSVQQVVFYFM